MGLFSPLLLLLLASSSSPPPLRLRPICKRPPSLARSLTHTHVLSLSLSTCLRKAKRAAQPSQLSAADRGRDPWPRRWSHIGRLRRPLINYTSVLTAPRPLPPPPFAAPSEPSTTTATAISPQPQLPCPPPSPLYSHGAQPGNELTTIFLALVPYHIQFSMEDYCGILVRGHSQLQYM